MCQDLGSSPATLGASRACNAFGCTQGYATQIADAPTAEVQAELKGKLCWANLPEEDWPDDPELRNMFEAIVAEGGKPVVMPKTALHGHTDSGTFQEQHCDAHVCARKLSSSFKPPRT